MLTAPFYAACFSYLLMLVAYFLPRQRILHIPVMLSIILFDVGMPIYLYTHRNWWKQLIEQQDIFSFLVWMHFGLLVTMYALDAFQVLTARKMLKGSEETREEARKEHRSQGRAMLVVRGLVILGGMMLANPE